MFLFIEMFNGKESRNHKADEERRRDIIHQRHSTPADEQLLMRLTRLGEKWSIPVAYSDDFGHGENSAILPIGVKATLDTGKCTLEYEWGSSEM